MRELAAQVRQVLLTLLMHTQENDYLKTGIGLRGFGSAILSG